MAAMTTPGGDKGISMTFDGWATKYDLAHGLAGGTAQDICELYPGFDSSQPYAVYASINTAVGVVKLQVWHVELVGGVLVRTEKTSNLANTALATTMEGVHTIAIKWGLDE